MWWYLENTEIPNLNYSSVITSDDVEEYLGTHLSKCNKSANIISEESVFQAYTIYRAHNLPVFIGKDVISNCFTFLKSLLVSLVESSSSSITYI